MGTPQKRIKYIYPILSPHDFGWLRISGSGLANCMFVVTRAYLLSCKYQCKLIAPTWRKFSIGPFLRRERDKRIYSDIFKTFGIRQRHVCARCLELDRNGLAGIAVCVNGFNQGFIGGSGAQTGKQGGAGVREELVFLIFLSLGPV